MQDQVQSRFNLSVAITIVVTSFLYIGNAHSQSILGESENDVGVHGSSQSSSGVLGVSESNFGVEGFSESSSGVRGSSQFSIGVHGSSESSIAVFGNSKNSYGVDGFSSQFHGAIFRGDKDGGYADIVLQGSSNSSTGDNGTIMSDPFFPGSDIFMVANDAVVAKLDNNKNGTGNFLVYNGNNMTIFQVDINGNVSAQGSTFNGSDRNRKEQIMDVSSPKILQAITEMPIYEWQYLGETRRHIGPMAQDFHKAFNLGDDDKTIATIDADGVALAAIKAQQEIIEKQNGEINSLEVEMESMKKEISKLKDLVSSLASQTKVD